MATGMFVPKLWYATIMRELEANLVATKICNAAYEGEIKKVGDTVYFNGLADPTINSYTKGSTITYEDLADARTSLTIDTQDYFAFNVEDIDKLQSSLDLKGSQAQRAAYKLKQAADTNVMGLYSTLTAGVTGTLNVVITPSKIAAVKQLLLEANVPDNQIWMVIPPWIQLKLELMGIYFKINDGTSIGVNGGVMWTKSMGFDLYVSNQVYNSGTVAAPVSEVLAGSYNSIAFASQINEVEDIRQINTFATSVRGLHSYGYKVIKPKEIVRATFTYAAETVV